MAALAKRGQQVAPFKVGPDFIDPGHHTRVTGTVSRNLDGWMISQEDNRRSFYNHTNKSDIAVVEGVMGLFDGYDGRSEAGSTAQMAKWLDLPIMLIVDARSMARSAAALVSGFEKFDPDLRFAGVLFNRVGSQRHLQYLQEALENHVDMPCLGGVKRDHEISIPERHLGLVTPQDYHLSNRQIERLTGLIEDSLDLDHLLKTLDDIAIRKFPPVRQSSDSADSVKIGVARDNAFCFYYEDNFDLLTSYGAELVYFSPVSDPSLPPDLDGLYFGGGYPELHAQRLAQNNTMRNAIKESSDAGMPIYGECGGFMYLGRQLVDLDGNGHPMADCFPVVTQMLPELKALGYREVRINSESILGHTGCTIRGHEFHYSELIEGADQMETDYRVSARAGTHQFQEGYRINNTLGSYIHLHFGSSKKTAKAFVESCRNYRLERK
jgi:cobyrinic acid a,c-diamide synthase